MTQTDTGSSPTRKTKYRQRPDHSLTGMPPGVPYIIGNEAAERFSFYGMRAILVAFMTKYLVDAAGNDATFTDEKAKGVFHLFVAAAYFTPMIGAMISDIFWGKYRTILFISLMYCVGHGCLALMDLGPVLGERGMGGWDMEPFLYSGLFLIALGAGGIKPCVSANVGDQFGHGNKRLMTLVFNWFYFSINVGAAASQFLTPILLEWQGPWLAFGLPGVLMGVATFIFWLGRHRFVHVPPAGWKRFKEETFSKEGVRALLNLSPLFLIFVPMFWAIFDQTGSAWVIQADQMNRQLGFTWLPSQIQFVNPILILTGIPIFAYLIYPLMGKLFTVSPLRKIGIGLVLTAGSFAISGLIQMPIDEKQASIAQTVYSDLATDVRASAGLSESRAASIAKASLVAASKSTLDPTQVYEITGLSVQSLRGAMNESRAAGLIPSEQVRELSAELGLTEPAGGYGSSEAVVNLVDAAIAAGWSDEQFAAAGITLSSLAAKARDEALAEVFPMDAAGDLFAVLADAAPQGSPNVLADAVRAARVVWVTEESANSEKPKSDESKIVGYLSGMPNIIWQFVAYLVLTCGEIMVSIVCLEFAYSQSPPKMKSFIMGVYFLGVSLGNIFVSAVNFVLDIIKKQNEGVNPLEGASYYWFFGILMFVTAIAYMVWSPFYKGQMFIQGDDELIHAEAEAEGTEKP